MKDAWKFVALAGIGMLIFAVIGRFFGFTTLGFGVVRVSGASGLLLAQSLLLVSILLKLWDK
jgi:hypothetical protein